MRYCKLYCKIFYFRLSFGVFTRCSAANNRSYPEMPSPSPPSSKDSPDDFDKPVKYSTSGAAQYRAYDSFFQETNAPWYQGYIASASVAVFLLYFCVLREENDLDELIYKPLAVQVPSLKEVTEVRQIGTDDVNLEYNRRKLK